MRQERINRSRRRHLRRTEVAPPLVSGSQFRLDLQPLDELLARIAEMLEVT
jgi:hypothetical protein